MTVASALPVKVQPACGESWLGYTRRVAARYGVSWAELMGPMFPGRTSRDLSKDQWHAGVFVGDASAQLFAAYFRLTVDEVQNMHLATVYGGSAVHVPDRAQAEFDPWGASPKTDHARLTDCGPIPNVQQQPVCWRCREREPRWLPLEWRLAWFPACDEHQLTRSITQDDQEAVDPDVSEAQKVIRSRLTSSPENGFFFEHLTVVAAALMGANPWTNLSSLPPVAVASALPAAVRAVTTQGYPEAQCLTGGGRRLSRDPAKVLRAPINSGAQRRGPRDVGRYPRLLPNSLFAGEISDILSPAMDNVDGMIRGAYGPGEVASITTAMARSGLCLHDVTGTGRTEGPRQLARLRRCVIRVLTGLERAGNLEAYWAAIEGAAESLSRANVDYGRRRSLIADDEFVDHFVRTADFDRYVALTWLAAEWAGEPVPMQWRPRDQWCLVSWSQLRDVDEPMGRILERAARRAVRHAA